MAGSQNRRRQLLAGFRCDAGELAEIREAAAVAGVSVAEFIRRAAMDRVVEVGMAKAATRG